MANIFFRRSPYEENFPRIPAEFAGLEFFNTIGSKPSIAAAPTNVCP